MKSAKILKILNKLSFPKETILVFCINYSDNMEMKIQFHKNNHIFLFY